MSAINFVVRDVAGNISRGSVAGEGVPPSLIVGSGADISLNLSQGQIISYTRQGQALEITLIDGRTITIEGFFTMEGGSENTLFLSADGYLTEVDLTQGAGEDYYANYIPDDGVGKYALNSDLYFMRSPDVMLADAYVPSDDEVGMLGTALGALGGVGLGGAAAAAGAAVILGGGGGGGGGSTPPAAPVVEVAAGTVEGNDHIVNKEDHADGVDIAGTGTPGGAIEVTIDGVTHTTTVDANGNWQVQFLPTEIDPGEYSTEVLVSITTEGGTTTVTNTLTVDTVIGAEIEATGGTDGVINGTEYGSGITLTGTVEGSETVVVTIDGVDYNATVTYNEATMQGTWTLAVPTSVMGHGEYTKEVTISTTDPAGNSYSTSAMVEVDTLIGVDVAQTGGADGIINAAEFGSGVTLTGTVEGNDAVTVTIGGQTYNAIVTYNEVTNTGTWTLDVPTSVMGEGEYTTDVTVSTTDAFGNTASTTTTVEVDTLIGVSADGTGGADSVVNATEYGSGVMLSGGVTGNDAVSVMINGQSYDAIVSYNEITNVGTWTLAVPTSVMGGGEYSQTVQVITTDAAGNSASTNMTVVVDTLIGVEGGQTGGADNVINGVEYGTGVVLGGTVTGNDAVTVTIDGNTYNAIVSYNDLTNEGTWSLAVPTSVMGEGEYTKTVSLSTTDAAGNTDTAQMIVEVDTYVNELTTTPVVAGDDIVNEAELAAGLTLSGTVEANSVVEVVFNHPTGQIVREASVDANGNWSLTYPDGVIPEGDYTANITINATDEHGNTDSITDTFRVDTVAPDAPGIENVTTNSVGVEYIGIDMTDNAVTVSEVTSSHQVNQLATEADGENAFGSTWFEFSPELSNGSHLVVNETDGSGNSNAAFVVLEETSTDVVDLGGLSGFDIGSIDLNFAQDAELTLDLATLEGLSDENNNLIIHGGVNGDNDTVTILGASDTGQTKDIDGKTYDLYTMGDDAEIFIEQGVNVIY